MSSTHLEDEVVGLANRMEDTEESLRVLRASLGERVDAPDATGLDNAVYDLSSELEDIRELVGQQSKIIARIWAAVEELSLGGNT